MDIGSSPVQEEVLIPQLAGYLLKKCELHGGGFRDGHDSRRTRGLQSGDIAAGEVPCCGFFTVGQPRGTDALLRNRQFSAPGLAGKCQKTITEITGRPNVSFLVQRILQIRNSVPGSWELIRRSRGSRGFPGSGTEAADRTLGNTRRSLRMT